MTPSPPTGSRYVAIGSSYAAGPLLRPRSAGSPLFASRSAGNYAHLVARRLGLDLTDVSYSGATAAQIIDGTKGRPAQIEAITPATELVTLTCGGNDVAYIGRLFRASLPRPLRELPPLRRRDAEDAAAVDVRLGELRATFDRLLAEVRRRAPEATVAVVDYLTLLPPQGIAAPPLRPEVAAWGRRTFERLAAETAAAAARADCLLVRASEASREHHAWSAHPWTTGFVFARDKAIYHPNHAGMEAVADLLAKRPG